MNDMKAIVDEVVKIYFSCDVDAKKAIELSKDIFKEKKIGGKKKMAFNYSEEEKRRQKKELEELLNQGKNVPQIAKILRLSTNTITSRIYKFKLKSPKMIRLEKAEIAMMEGFIPPNLDIGKEYVFHELDANGRAKTGKRANKIKGRIVDEYPAMYRIDTGKYKENINKNSMMDYKIKAI